MVLLAAAHGFAFYDRLLVAFLAPVIKSALALSDTQLGIVLGSAFALAFSGTSLAMVAGDIGTTRRGIFALGIMTWTGATAACGLVTSFAGLLAARAILGMAQAVLSPIALPAIAEAVPRPWLGRAVATFTSAATLGRSAAMLGGAGILSWVAAPLAGHDAWRLLFLLSALPNVLLALFLAAKLPRAAVPRTRPDRGLRAWITTDIRHLAGLAASSAAVVLVIQTTAAWATSLLTRRFGLSVAEAGTLYGLVVLVAAPAGHGIGGWLVDRVTSRYGRAAPVLLMAAALCAVLPFAAILATTKSLALAGAALVAHTLVLGIASPLGPFGIQIASPPALRGRATAGLVGGVTAVGFGLGPATLGVLNDRLFGPAGIGLALLCLCSVAALVGLGAALSTSHERSI